MRQELTQKLFNDFPLLYSGHTLPVSENLMSFGFACHDGWYMIIRSLSQTLTELIHKQPEEQRRGFVAVQVKEKLGGLRFYMSRTTVEMREAINIACEAASRTCEVCGSEEENRQGVLLMDASGWLATLCDTCREDKARKRAERFRNRMERRQRGNWELDADADADTDAGADAGAGIGTNLAHLDHDANVTVVADTQTNAGDSVTIAPLPVIGTHEIVADGSTATNGNTSVNDS